MTNVTRDYVLNNEGTYYLTRPVFHIAHKKYDHGAIVYSYGNNIIEDLDTITCGPDGFPLFGSATLEVFVGDITQSREWDYIRDDDTLFARAENIDKDLFDLIGMTLAPQNNKYVYDWTEINSNSCMGTASAIAQQHVGDTVDIERIDEIFTDRVYYAIEFNILTGSPHIGRQGPPTDLPRQIQTPMNNLIDEPVSLTQYASIAPTTYGGITSATRATVAYMLSEQYTAHQVYQHLATSSPVSPVFTAASVPVAEGARFQTTGLDGMPTNVTITAVTDHGFLTSEGVYYGPKNRFDPGGGNGTTGADFDTWGHYTEDGYWQDSNGVVSEFGPMAARQALEKAGKWQEVEDAQENRRSGGDEAGDGKPVQLDLNGDGKIAMVSMHESSAYFDIDGDGLRERTSWIGIDRDTGRIEDGFLVGGLVHRCASPPTGARVDLNHCIVRIF